MSNYQVHLLVPLAHNNESHPFGPNDRPCMTINKRFKGIGPSPNLTHSAVFCAHKFSGKKEQKVRISLIKGQIISKSNSSKNRTEKLCLSS